MLKKITITILILIVVLVASAFSVSYLFKDDILAKVKTSINKNLNAKVNFKSADITLLTSFPDLGVKLNKLTVIGIDSFATDTLANIDQISIDMNLMSVIKGETYQIKSVKLDNPVIYAHVLKSGKANWDITKPDSSNKTPEKSKPFKAALNKYEINNGKVIYDDASLNMYMQMDGLKHSGKGDFTEDVFTLETKSDIEKLTVKYGGITYLNQAKISADLPFGIDMKQKKYTLSQNKISLNELVLSLVGNLTMPNDTDMLVDFKFNTEKSELKNFLSLIPAIYSQNFKDLQASGKFAMNGFAKGTYNEKSLPAFNLNLLVENGLIKYPSLPSAINNIQVKATVTNPDGVLDHTEINVPAFTLAFGKEPVNGHLLVKTPVSDPLIDMALTGKLDLKQLTTIFPLKDMTLSGILNADVKANGRKSAIDKGNYQDFKSSGQVLVSNFNYSGANVPKPVSIPNASLVFTPQNISVTNLSAKVGKSDFQANGSISNYLSYIFDKNGFLKGTFDVSSGLVDVNELMGSATTPAQTSNTKMSVIEVPGNIDFTLNAKAGRVIYDKYDIQNAKGTIAVKDNTLSFRNMGMNMLDGTLSMNGTYATVNPKKPKVDMDLAITKMDIQKAFKAFNTIQLLAPVAQYSTGNFSTNLKFNSDLGQDMMPLYSSINASGFANIIQAIIQGFEPLNQLSAALKTDKFKKLEVNNLLTKFNISNGRLSVAPFDIKNGDLNMNVQGSNGLDKSLAYQLGLTVPRAWLGAGANSTVNALLSKASAATKTNINLSENIKVNALLGGSITKPTIKLQLNELKESGKSAITQAIDSKKEEAKAKISEEINKQKAKAQEELKKRTDSIKKQAEQDAKNKIKDKLKGIFN
ncbi:MAG: AsmA-like C-terminal region-containing protein [Daejeonella sp.]